MRIRNLESLTNHGNIEGRQTIAQIMEAGLEAADPYYNACRLITVENNVLSVGADGFIPKGDPKKEPERIDLTQIDRIFVFGAGKGVQRIALAIEEKLGNRLTGGRIILKHSDESNLKIIAVSYGGHPVPDEACVLSSKEMVSDIEKIQLTENDLVFTIIGNGASSLMTLPPKDISLDSVKALTRILQIEKGLPTDEVNKCRNQVDLLKGGRLTRLLFPAKLIHIEAIDVNEPNMLGKKGYLGWTQYNYWLHSLPDLRTPMDAIDLLKRNAAWDRVNEDIRDYLVNKAQCNPCLSLEEFEEKGGRFFGLMSPDTNFMSAASKKSAVLGYSPHILTRKTGIEASAVGKMLGRIAVQVCNEDEPFSAPCAILLTGEMLVSVGKESGVGGRNQECCLASAKIIEGNERIIIAAADTDGTDGPGGHFNENATTLGCTILAGGIVDGYTMQEAQKSGVCVEKAIQTHSTSNALWELNSGIWATQNISLNDLIVILIQKK